MPEYRSRGTARPFSNTSGSARPKPAAPQRAAVPQQPLGDDRFQELMKGASAFFAAAERDEVAEKAQVIKEIRALMAYHGLSAGDLLD